MALDLVGSWFEISEEDAASNPDLLHHAVGNRTMLRDVTGGASGVATASSMMVTEKAGTADMSVDIGMGGAFVPSTRSANQGTYHFNNSSIHNQPITASHPTNDRIDRILLRAKDPAQDAIFAGNAGPEFYVVEGTPASVPELPPITVDDWIELARVLVPAGASSITNADITDVRQVVAEAGREVRLLERVVLPSNSATVASSPIPSWVNNLEVQWSFNGAGGGTTAHNLGLQFNNDGGSNYRWARLLDGAFSASASAIQIVVGLLDNSTAGISSWGTVKLIDLKGVVGLTRAEFNGGYFSGGEHHVTGTGRWTNFGVTSLRFVVTGNFQAGSTMWLYGSP